MFCFVKDIAAADNAPTHPIVLPSTSQCSTMSSSILQTKLVTWPDRCHSSSLFIVSQTGSSLTVLSLSKVLSCFLIVFLTKVFDHWLTLFPCFFLRYILRKRVSDPLFFYLNQLFFNKNHSLCDGQDLCCCLY